MIDNAPTRALGADRMRSPFLPLIFISTALLAWLAFQTYQLLNERLQLSSTHTAQAAQLEAAAKIRTSLDTLAAATARLADSGNVNARALVEELRRRGITINPSAQAVTPSSSK